MQHTILGSPKRAPLHFRRVPRCQAWVRFFALHRIKPHTPPLVRAPSISLSFSLATALPRRVLIALATAPRHPGTQHPSFYSVTTRVSNPVCYPRFRTSASVTVQVAAFATGVPSQISTDFTPHLNSATLSALSLAVSKAVPQLGCGFHLTKAAYVRFTPSDSD